MEKSNVIPGIPVQGSEIPIGLICMWAGEEKNVPKGWVVCDGRKTRWGQSTAILSSCFIVGVGKDTVGTQGEASKIEVMSGGPHVHTSKYYPKAAINTTLGSTILPVHYTEDSGDHCGDHSHNLNIDTKELRPKWYALYFIMYQGFD